MRGHAQSQILLLEAVNSCLPDVSGALGSGWDFLERRPSSGALTAGNSSAEATTHVSVQPQAALAGLVTPPSQRYALVSFLSIILSIINMKKAKLLCGVHLEVQSRI